MCGPTTASAQPVRDWAVPDQHRPHRVLDDKTPKQVYYDNLTTRLTAA